MKDMELQVKKLLSYSVVFPDKHDRIEDLLANVPSAKAIEVLSYHLSRKMNQLIGQHDWNIWKMWLEQTRIDIRVSIDHYALQHNLANYALIDPYAMLLLISKLLVFYNGRHEELTEDDITNLFLSYMICCDERLALNKTLPNNIEKTDDFVESFLPSALKTYDIESPRDYRLMLIKCYCLLIEFPKKHTQFATFLDEFCKEKGLQTVKAYLDQLFQVFLELSSQGDISTSLMEVDPICQETIQFLDSFSMETEHYHHDMDFKMIREKPLLKTKLRRYDFIFMKMFLDKAYTGFLFDMKEVLVKLNLLDEREGYGKLKSMLGEDFSERFFFYILMKRCFEKHYVNYTGEELQKLLGGGMPDYYLRRGNRIFIFECKDAQLAAYKKLSGDFTIVKDAIFEKYVKSAEGRDKGVTQLANVIADKLAMILNTVDNSVPKSTLFIFPIIVYFDDCFDLEGPNYLLDKEFKRQIREKTIIDDYKVKDLIMINIEQLMRLENFFADDRLKLATLINSYIDYKNQKDLNQLFPFNKFLFQEARKKGYEGKKTRWFDEVYQSLVTMDKNRKI